MTEVSFPTNGHSGFRKHHIGLWEIISCVRVNWAEMSTWSAHTETVYESTGHHQTSAFSSCLHVSQHAPLVNIRVISFHAGMASAAVEAPGNVDHVCRRTNQMEQVERNCCGCVSFWESTARRQWWWHGCSLTAECCSASEAAAHIHGGDGVPDAILVRRVVQALHGAEPRAPVVASDHVNSIVQRHRGDVTPFPCNVLVMIDLFTLGKYTKTEHITRLWLKFSGLTGRKLHSCVFGSYFSTISIGDCWLPNPPITSRTSLAPEKTHKSILISSWTIN